MGKIIGPLIFIFWPLAIILFQYLIILSANAYGCKIWALGPEVCMVFGFDIGGFLYPLWTLGYQMALALFWVVPALVIWLLVKIFFLIKDWSSK